MNRNEWKIAKGCGLLIVLILAGGMINYYRLLNAVPVYVPPPAKMPVPNAFDDYVAAAKMLAENGGADGGLLKPQTAKPKGSMPGGSFYAKGPGIAPVFLSDAQRRKKIGQIVSANRETLAKLKKALHKPCRVPLLYHYEDTIPYLFGFRELARLLAMEQSVYARQGQWAKAAKVCLDGIEFGIHAFRGGWGSDKAAEMAVISILARPLTGYIDKLNASDAISLARRLENAAGRREPFAVLMECERVVSLAALSNLFREKNIYNSLLYLNRLVDGNEFERVGMKTLLTYRGKSRSFHLLDRFYQELIAEARKPYARFRMPPVPKDAVAGLLGIDITHFYRRFLHADARLRLLYTALALRAYRLGYGHYPQTLSELIPGYLRALPEDPFTGKPLAYHKRGRRYLLYSIGPDLCDDGGRPLPRRFPNSPRDIDGKGDITPEE